MPSFISTKVDVLARLLICVFYYILQVFLAVLLPLSSYYYMIVIRCDSVKLQIGKLLQIARLMNYFPHNVCPEYQNFLWKIPNLKPLSGVEGGHFRMRNVNYTVIICLRRQLLITQRIKMLVMIQRGILI